MTPPETPISSTLAVIHGRQGRWACVAGVPLPGGRFRIVDRTVLDDEDQLQEWITRIDAGAVRVVLPAAETICRTSVLPEGNREELEETLGLQAETQLLGTAPPHRMGMTVIPAAERDVARTGLVMAWPESSPFRGPSVEPPPLYVPDVSGLMSLVGTARPAEPVIWMDPANDSLALVLTHMQGVQVRALREEFPADDATAVVSAAVAETGMQADLPIERVRTLAEQATSSMRPTGPQLMLPESVMASMTNRLELDEPLTDQDRDEFGIAMGCLLATGDDFVATTIFRESLPEIKPSLVEATSQQLSSGRTAAWLLVAGILLMLFAPVAISGARLGLLRIAHPSLAARVQDSERQDRQYRMYRVLSGEAWPMTKLLADLSNATPEGIELEQVRLGHGEPVKITGKATHPDSSEDARELVAQMKANLESTGVFNDVVIRYDAQETFGPRNFSIDAQVAKPLYRPRYDPEADFGVRTLASRLYGDSADAGATASAPPRTPPPPSASTDRVSSPRSAAPAVTPPPAQPPVTATAPAAEAPTATPSSPRRPSRRPSGSSGGGATRADADARGGNSGATMAGRIPEMLSTEQIAAMTDTQIRQQLVEVSQARKITRKDPELNAKLNEQFNLLFEALKSRANLTP